MGKGIFVAGTDTGVGKTVVAAGLAALLRNKGIDIGVMKPLESGCPREKDKLIPRDAIMLRQSAGCQDELHEINPYALHHPLAPALAAELEAVDINMEFINQTYESQASRHDFVIVEGAGGLLVPITDCHLMADLIKMLKLPLLLVTKANLGTINHTLLTLYYAGQELIPVIGVVMNCLSQEQGLAESMNPAAVQRWGWDPLLGVLPFLPEVTIDNVCTAIEANLDLKPIEALLR